MGDQKHGSSGLFMKMQEDIVHDLFSGFRIQALEGLVQKEQIPGGQQGAQQRVEEAERGPVRGLVDGLPVGDQEMLAINEGLSTLSEDLCGYSMGETEESNTYLANVASAYLSDPGSYSFTSFGNAQGEYGHSYLLMRYMADQYGVETINELATTRRVGIENLEYALQGSFADFYRDFGITNAVSDMNNAPAKYNYKSISLAANYLRSNAVTQETEAAPLGLAKSEFMTVPATSKDKAYSWTDEVLPWSSNYYSFAYPDYVGNLEIAGKGPIGVTTFKLMTYALTAPEAESIWVLDKLLDPDR